MSFPQSRFGTQPITQAIRQTYEQYKPRSEWKYENDATLLLLYLPGFMRELITHVTDTSLGTINIQGQRTLAIGRWSQFSEVHKIPETCDASKITSQFENGVLTIVMPKLIVTKQIDDLKHVAETKTTIQETTSSPQQITVGDQKSTPQASEVAANAMDQKPREEKKLLEALTTQKMKGEDDTSSEAATAMEKPREENMTNEGKSQKGEDESTFPKAASLVDNNRKQPDENRVASGLSGGDSSVDQNQKVEEKKEKNDEAIDQKPAAESEKPENVMDKALVPSKESAASEAVAPKTEIEKEKNDDDKSSSKSKEEEDSIAAQKSKEEKGGGVGLEQSEDRSQWFINMGTVLLFIFGLGAYISYTVASSRKVKR